MIGVVSKLALSPTSPGVVGPSTLSGGPKRLAARMGRALQV